MKVFDAVVAFSISCRSVVKLTWKSKSVKVAHVFNSIVVFLKPMFLILIVPKYLFIAKRIKILVCAQHIFFFFIIIIAFEIVI